MGSRPPGILLLLTLLGFGSLYTPQPLLPALSLAFGIGVDQASLLITLTLLPLGVAPLAYGYLLEGVPARPMLGVATLGLALCQTGLALADAWWHLLALRALEGLFLPALFTALMTLCAASARPGQTRQAMAWYVATSILGGFGGRAISGFLGEYWHWRAAFALWALGLVVALLATRRLGETGPGRFSRPHPRVFGQILGQARFRYAYLSIFCVFCVFAGLLNVLPFRLRDLVPDLGSGAIGLAYTGYLVGIAVTLGGQGLARRLGSQPRALGLGGALYGASLLVFALAQPTAVYLGMLAFCAGMFLIHGLLSGQVNHWATESRGVVNGLYLAAYYLGGSLGSWLAPLIYREWGWEALLILLGGLVLGAALSLGRMLTRAAPDEETQS